MSGTRSTHGPAATPPPRAFVVAAVALSVAVFVLPLVLGTPLLDPDEGLHAAIAQEMVERGDWITPRFLGEPFLDKPALFFWALAGSLAGFGFTEFAVKLPGVLFGALGALATALLARRMFGPRAGALGFVFQATLLLPLALTEVAVHDVALVPWTTLAMLALYDAASQEDMWPTLRAGALAGVWLGFAVLTKALTGVVLVGLPFAAWCVVTLNLKPRLIAAGVLSLVVAAAIAAPWYLAMEAANPGYLHYYFVERHLMGYATTTQLHGQRAWWYYVPVLLGGSLPWIVYVVTPLRDAWTAWRTRERSERIRALELLLLWLTIDLAFLSAAGSKLVTYVLPIFPAMAILAAYAWDRAIEAPDAPPFRPSRTSHVLACAAMACALPGAVLVARSWLGLTVGVLIGAAAAATTIAWILAAATALRSTPWRTLTTMTAAMAVTVTVALAVVLPSLAPSFSAREVARHYNRQGRLPGTVWFYDERVGSFLFYLDAPLRASLTADRVVRARPELLLAMRHAPGDTDIVVPVEELARLEKRVPLAGQPSVLAGHHRVYTSEDFVAALRAAVDGR